MASENTSTTDTEGTASHGAEGTATHGEASHGEGMAPASGEMHTSTEAAGHGGGEAVECDGDRVVLDMDGPAAPLGAGGRRGDTRAK